ncbi:hypothetical protein NPIL_615991 [Nephila pilipes]|uniref:Uncharacterized protein n=1 Tax=Nephila pilipes TaxID=299642 RepID=A0A8X6TC27_NEPPI|nr:hypothetical protein NPIL_615991 [Nephila pilipes]
METTRRSDREYGQEEEEDSTWHGTSQETGFKSVEDHRGNRFSGKLLREGERRCSETGSKETIRSSRGTHKTEVK